MAERGVASAETTFDQPAISVPVLGDFQVDRVGVERISTGGKEIGGRQRGVAHDAIGLILETPETAPHAPLARKLDADPNPRAHAVHRREVGAVGGAGGARNVYGSRGMPSDLHEGPVNAGIPAPAMRARIASAIVAPAASGDPLPFGRCCSCRRRSLRELEELPEPARCPPMRTAPLLPVLRAKSN